MVVTIRQALGPRWYERKLYDDNSLSYGGISREEETLGEFVNNSNLNAYEDSIGELQNELKFCGIKQIEEADSYVEELIQQKLWDLQNELDVIICDFRWDYKNG